MLCQMVISAVGIKQPAKGDWEYQSGVGVGERQGHDFQEACQRSAAEEIMFEQRPKEEVASHVSFQGKVGPGMGSTQDTAEDYPARVPHPHPHRQGPSCQAGRLVLKKKKAEGRVCWRGRKGSYLILNRCLEP